MFMFYTPQARVQQFIDNKPRRNVREWRFIIRTNEFPPLYYINIYYYYYVETTAESVFFAGCLPNGGVIHNIIFYYDCYYIIRIRKQWIGTIIIISSV